MKSLVIVILFLSFKGITISYLLKIPVTHMTTINPLLNLLINCISSRSAPQILSIKDGCTFLSWKFIIIGLCNSSSNSLFEIFLFSIPLQGGFYQKIDHWSKSTLIFIMFQIFSNSKCFITQYFIRSCSSS